MDIRTKFNLDETVYFMESNIVVEAAISAVRTFNSSNNKNNISYSATDAKNTRTWLDYETLQVVMAQQAIALSVGNKLWTLN